MNPGMNRPAPPLDAFPCLRDASIEAWLGRGFAAESWRLRTRDGQVVLRRDLPMAARLGLDRENEWVVLKHVASAGLGPEPLALDLDRGLLVTRWQPRPAWRPSDLRQPEAVRTLGRLLRRVHKLAPVGKRFDPARIARTYARRSGGENTSRLVDAVEQMAARLYPPGLAGCLCHHDAHAGNVLGKRPPMLLDWEYAAVGSPWMDLAVVVRFHRFGERRVNWLLEGWMNSAVGDDAPARVRAHAELYDHLAELWSRVVSGKLAGRDGQA